MVQRAVAVMVRWVLWCVTGWLAYYLVRIGVGVLRRHQGVPLSLVALSIPYNLLSVLVASAVLVAMIVVPYAYVVWAKPERRFWGETLSWWVGAGRAVIIGVVVGASLALTAPGR